MTAIKTFKEFFDIKFPRVRSTDPITSFEAADSIKETAAIQECTIDAIKQRLSRGRKMLAEALSEKLTKTITS